MGTGYIGILVEIFVADLLTVIGLSGQKLALMQSRLEQEKLRAERRRLSTGFEYDEEEEYTGVAAEISAVKNPKWLAAFAIFIIGQASEAISLSFASQSDVASVSNITLFWNAIFSVFLFKEKFTIYPTYPELSPKLFERWDLFSCTVLIFGSIVTVLSTPQPDEKGLSAEKLMSMWFDFPYVIYALLLIISMSCFAVMLWRNWGNETTGNFNAVLVALLAAMISSFTVTMSKVEMTLIGNSFKEGNQFKSFGVFFMSLIWILSMISSIGLLNVGLGHFEQGLIVPIYEVAGTLVTITSGILFYQTYTQFSVLQFFGLVFGISCMCWGIWLVSKREHHSEKELDAAFSGSLPDDSLIQNDSLAPSAIAPVENLTIQTDNGREIRDVSDSYSSVSTESSEINS